MPYTLIFLQTDRALYIIMCCSIYVSLSSDTDYIPVKQTKIRNGDTTVTHRRRLEADVKINVNEIYRPMWKNSIRV